MSKRKFTVTSNQAKPLNIQETINFGVAQLTHCSDTPRLDCEILLLHALNWNNDSTPLTKTWLLTWPEKNLSPEQLQQFYTFLKQRCQGQPVAYITGEKAFWSFILKVSNDTLIPRPETETLVECALAKIPRNSCFNIADLGTGSGAVALAIASEAPGCQLWATDYSYEAIAIAKYNAQQLHINNIGFIQSYWLESIKNRVFDLIVSNPPYICENDPHLQDNAILHEPQAALQSGSDGLKDIKVIIQQARQCLKEQGWLLIEHGYNQKHRVSLLLKKYGFNNISTINDLNNNPRVSMAQRHG